MTPKFIKPKYSDKYKMLPTLEDISTSDTDFEIVIFKDSNQGEKTKIKEIDVNQYENNTIKYATSILPAGIFVGTDKYTEQLNYYRDTYLALLDLKKKGKLNPTKINELLETPDSNLEKKINKLTGKSRIKSA